MNKGIRDWGLGIRGERSGARGQRSGVRGRRAVFSTPQTTGHYPLATNHYPLVTGFTLVELLVVVAIIGILASLITAAAWRAVITARNAAIKVEITKLDLACKAFKEKFGDYPPDFSDYDALTRFLKRAFPNATSYPTAFRKQSDFVNAKDLYNPATALGFWLSGPAGKGFSANTQNPFDVDASGAYTSTVYASRIAPFYDFDASRLTSLAAATTAYRYYPPNVTNSAPYVYFRATASGVYNSSYSWPTGSAWPTTTSLPPLPYFQNSVYINPKGYQILCAGRDGVYGTGTNYPGGVSVSTTITAYTDTQYDDMSNFTDGTMEQAMP